MFNRISGRYNLMNRIMTGWQDNRWRRYLLRAACLTNDAAVLDVATGTGDILFEAVKRFKGLTAVGVDFSEEMLNVAKRRTGAKQIKWIQTDAMYLPFADNAFDAVLSGFLIRNVVNVRMAFCEQHRVLKSGGIVVCLDTTPPDQNFLEPFFRIYFKIIIPFLGRLIAKDIDAYTYLTESTRAFQTAGQVADGMRQAGFEAVTYQKFMFGAVAVHRGKKP